MKKSFKSVLVMNLGIIAMLNLVQSPVYAHTKNASTSDAQDKNNSGTMSKHNHKCQGKNNQDPNAVKTHHWSGNPDNAQKPNKNWSGNQQGNKPQKPDSNNASKPQQPVNQDPQKAQQPLQPVINN